MFTTLTIIVAFFGYCVHVDRRIKKTNELMQAIPEDNILSQADDKKYTKPWKIFIPILGFKPIEYELFFDKVTVFNIYDAFYEKEQ